MCIAGMEPGAKLAMSSAMSAGSEASSHAIVSTVLRHALVLEDRALSHTRRLTEPSLFTPCSMQNRSSARQLPRPNSASTSP